MSWIPATLSIVGVVCFVIAVFDKDHARSQNFLLRAIYLELSAGMAYLIRM